MFVACLNWHRANTHTFKPNKHHSRCERNSNDKLSTNNTYRFRTLNKVWRVEILLRRLTISLNQFLWHLNQIWLCNLRNKHSHSQVSKYIYTHSIINSSTYAPKMVHVINCNIRHMNECIINKKIRTIKSSLLKMIKL